MNAVKANDIWLNKMPSDWQRIRIRNVAVLSPNYSQTRPAADEPCTVVPMELLSEDGSIDASNQPPLEEVTSGLTFFEEGDVLFAKVTPCMENGKGAFVRQLPTRYAFGSTEFHVLRPSKKINGRFLYYATFNPIYRCASINGANEILNIRVVSIGLIDRSPVHPREVFADALSDRASAVVVAHNHPSGGLEPSPSDIEITRQLKAADNIVGIELLDHIIFNRTGYFSFLEEGKL